MFLYGYILSSIYYNYIITYYNYGYVTYTMFHYGDICFRHGVTCHGRAPMTSGFGDVASPVASTPRRTAWVARSMSWPNAGPEPRWFDMTKSP